MILPHVYNIPGICNKVTLVILYNVSSRPVTDPLNLFIPLYMSVSSVCEVINFALWIFVLVVAVMSACFTVHCSDYLR